MTSLEVIGAIGFVGGIAAAVSMYVAVSRAGRRSTANGAAAIWLRSAIVAVLFASIFVVALPWAAHWLLPQPVPLPRPVSSWGGATLFLA